MPNARYAFTVLESMIVLFISGLILMVTLLLVNLLLGYQRDENQFWQRFSDEWHLAEEKAVQTQQSIMVTFNNSNVHFTAVPASSYERTINYPRGIKMLNQPTQIQIYENGFVNPKTISWYSETSHQKWYQKFQLGWGVYRLEKVR